MGLKLFHSIWTEGAMNVVRCGKIQDHKARTGSIASIITNLNVYTHDKILSLVLHIILKLEWNYVHYILELTLQSHLSFNVFLPNSNALSSHSLMTTNEILRLEVPGFCIAMASAIRIYGQGTYQSCRWYCSDQN